MRPSLRILLTEWFSVAKEVLRVFNSFLDRLDSISSLSSCGQPLQCDDATLTYMTVAMASALPMVMASGMSLEGIYVAVSKNKFSKNDDSCPFLSLIC